MNRRRVMAASLLLAALAFGTPSSAQDRAQLIAGLDSFRDPAAARRLEDRLASLVERKDEAGLRQLGNDVRAKDGALLARLEGLTAKPRANGMAVDPELARVALSMGSCHHANLLIRKVVLAIAAGEAKPVLRDGAVRLDGSQVDSLYAEMIGRCERLARLPERTPKLGSACQASAGACDDEQDAN